MLKGIMNSLNIKQEPVLEGIVCPRELCAPERNSLALKVGNMVSPGDFGVPWNCIFWTSMAIEILILSHVELDYLVGKVLSGNVYEINDTKIGGPTTELMLFVSYL